MRIPKLLLTFCAMSVCAGFISIRAEDTPEQAAARAALQQKMREADAQKAGIYFVPLTNANNGSFSPVPEASDSKMPVPTQPAAQTTPPVETFGDNPAQAAARAALMKKMQELDNAASAFPTDNPEQAAARLALEKKMKELNAPITPVDNPAQAAARAALEKKMAELPPPVAAPQKPWETKRAPETATNVSYTGKELGLLPIVAPPLPISPDKAARLQTLLQQYKADQVSPDEYQKQRAAILAEP